MSSEEKAKVQIGKAGEKKNKTQEPRLRASDSPRGPKAGHMTGEEQEDATPFHNVGPWNL